MSSRAGNHDSVTSLHDHIVEAKNSGDARRIITIAQKCCAEMLATIDDWEGEQGERK